MRKENSITDKTFNAINEVGAGNTFTISQIYSQDLACNSCYSRRQRVYDILCMLNKTGLIARVKRGTYKLMYEIPEQLTFTDVEYYCGYRTRYTPNSNVNVVRKKNPFDIDSYKNQCDVRESDQQGDSMSETTTVYEVVDGADYNGRLIYRKVEVPIFDESWKANFTIFETEEHLLEMYTDAIFEDDVDDLMSEGLNDSISDEIFKAVNEKCKSGEHLKDDKPTSQEILEYTGLKELVEEINSPQVGQKIYYVDKYNKGFSVDERIIEEVIKRKTSSGTRIEIITESQELYMIPDPEICFTRSSVLERVREFLS